MQQVISEKIKEAELVLVGIGEDFALKKTEDEIQRACQRLSALLEGKNYFIITTGAGDMLCKVGFRGERIVRPLREEETAEEEKTDTVYWQQWDDYTKWLQGTLHKKLLVMELGVGLRYPTVIRFPFEKIVYFNRKAQLLRIHDKLYQLPAELNGRGISIQADPAVLFASGEI